jgi:hypothetical protein
MAEPTLGFPLIVKIAVAVAVGEFGELARHQGGINGIPIQKTQQSLAAYATCTARRRKSLGKWARRCT